MPSSVVERPLSEPRPSTTVQPAAASASAAASGEVARVAAESDFGRGRFGGDQGGLGARALTIWARAGMSLQPGTWRRGAEVVPKFDAVLAAGLQEAEEGVAAVAADVGAGSAADLALGDVATDVVLGAVGVQRDIGSFEHLQQFALVGPLAGQQRSRVAKPVL